MWQKALCADTVVAKGFVRPTGKQHLDGLLLDIYTVMLRNRQGGKSGRG
jgi:hypothetical protein